MLKTIGAIGIPTAAIGIGAGAAHNNGGGRGNPQESCECSVFAKYDYDSDAGTFEHTAGWDFVNITGYESKSGETNEPISVTYNTAYKISRICSFGGRDNHLETNPGSTYESDLANPGGQQAAISNITFCIEYGGIQVDLIHGSTIPDDEYGRNCSDQSISRTYGDRGSVLAAWWSGPSGGEYHDDPWQNLPEGNDDSYAHCGILNDDVSDVAFDWSNRIAKIELDLSDSSCSPSEFGFLAYFAPDNQWWPDEGCNQVLHDEDRSPVHLGGSVYEYTVQLPPLP